ncbi:MAG TPA: hypothetical protein VFX69_08305, partial [Steroidobacteraceae bacterium]|nr:hypothetical protein [Steroidobacteraceae bacterium]
GRSTGDGGSLPNRADRGRARARDARQPGATGDGRVMVDLRGSRARSAVHGPQPMRDAPEATCGR